MDFSQDYIPGVFDKLDAQIFGKILPPYMLEKNVPAPYSNNGDVNSVGMNPATYNLSGGRLMAPRSPLSNIVSGTVNLDDFDFYSFGGDGQAGAGNGSGGGNGNSVDLEYLDPFNSRNDQN